MNFWRITRILQFPRFKTYLWNFFKSFLTNDENSTILQENAHIRFSTNPRRSLQNSNSTCLLGDPYEFLTNDEKSTILQGNAHIRFSTNPRCSLQNSNSTCLLGDPYEFLTNDKNSTIPKI